MSLSKLPFNHPNCGPHNRIIYELNYRFLRDNIRHVRGDIVDLGCGERPYEAWLIQYGRSYIGIDWSETLHCLRADIVADLNKPLPVADAVADTIISFSVLEHLQKPTTLLAEAYRILKPSGTLLLQVPFMWGVHEAPHDYYRFTRFGLQVMAKDAGYQNVSIIPQCGYWTAAVLKANYQMRRLIRGPRLVRWPLSWCARIVWWVDQPLALMLDKHAASESETIGYFMVASKP